jgi:hypothetical protein
MGEKQPDIYSGVAHITDGMYHAIKIIRRLTKIELYIDGIQIKLEGGNSMLLLEKKFKEIFFLLFRKFTSIRTTNISCTKTFTYWKF